MGLRLFSLLRVLSRHLGFAKRGELGRVKEDEEGGGVGVGEGLELANYFMPWPFLTVCL